MLLRRTLAMTLAGIAALSGLIVPHSAWAQDAPVPRLQPRRQPPARQNLSSFVEKLGWDVATRGPLLIVSPEEAIHAPFVFAPLGELVPSTEELTADVDGSYALPAFAAYFDRKLERLHTLSVLMPLTMTLLNDRDLPPPNIFEGMSPIDKNRLLESTFTPEQWKQLCGPDGIGVGDMTREQRALYLSMLPDPFVLDPITTAPGRYGFAATVSGDPVTLTPAQREGVRLSLQKQLNWNFSTGPRGMMYNGDPTEVLPVAGPNYALHPENRRPRNTASTIFGATLTREMPARPKTSQLPEGVPDADATVSLTQDMTVGDLIHRIAQQTNLELYCDPRYAGRKLYVRGESAGAGDVLRALALSVTGTWRRVGPTYVLTDDVEGLGVRHARIADWISLAALLAVQRQEEVEHALMAANIDDITHWAESDPLGPNATLIAKIDAYENTPSDDQPTPPLFIPRNELPLMAQTIIGEQLKAIQARPDSANATLRTDGVNLMIGTRSMYVIPGMPRIPAVREGSGNLSPRRFHDKPSDGLSHRPPDTTLPAIAFPANCPNRALLIAPHNEDELTRAIPEAHRAGFNQLWVQTPRNETSLLVEAIRLGKASGLSVRAVVRPLQPIATDAPTILDCTILGETTTAYAKRKRATLRQAGIPDEEPTVDWRSGGSMLNRGRGNPAEWRNVAAVNRLLLRGDYLRTDDPAVHQQLIADLSKIAATPGLSGLVLRDVAPVGYPRIPPLGETTTMDGIDPIYDPLLALGYTESLRLACLRMNGFDPIDLSALSQGDQIAPLAGAGPGQGVGRPVSVELPFFRDMGVSGLYTYRGSGSNAMNVGVTMGARDSLTSWKNFRADTADAFLHTVLAGVHAACPDMPIATSIEGQLGRSALWFADVSDVKAPAPSVTETPPSRVSGFHSDRLTPLQHARAEAKTVYHLVPFGSLASDPAIAHAEALQRLENGFQLSDGWDGVVIDLTGLSPERAEAVLRVLP